ncbi:unnamed protein product [Rhizophagus irregularis]|nr:unnamed protein product [Rhizophagus irregularis]
MPKLFTDLITKCWDANVKNRPTAKELYQILNKWNKEKYYKDSEIYFQINKCEKNESIRTYPVKNLSSEQQIIRQFKLNHGLFLDGRSIKPSEHAIFIEDGKLNMSLYDSQPLVYVSVNVNDSRVNLLSFNSDNNIDYDKTLRLSDICINFPVAEISYTANLTESFLNFINNGVTSYEKYGHLFARKVLVGGKLFINGLKSATSAQADAFKSNLSWIYNLARYNKETSFMNLPTSDFFPRVRTLDGEDLNTYEKLTNWMTNLYQNNMIDIISYNNLIPVSELRFSESSSIDEKQPGVVNFKERLSFEDWAVYANLIRWINENNLFQGLIIDKHFELAFSKKIAVNFTKIPDVDSSNNSYLKMVRSTTKVEEFLTSNNIFSIKDIGSFPFINEIIRSENISYKDCTHLLVKLERYRITSDIVPSEEFKQDIVKALESMKPFMCLQNVFDEYGYFFSLNIVLGKSLKNISRTPLSYNSEEIYLETESLKSHLDKLNVSYLLTKKGDVIKKKDLSNWIQNTNNDLEVIEFDNIIPLYHILEIEQQKKIDVILNKNDKLRIVMTGIEELKDLDIKNTEHYKRINIEPSLEDKDYEVFGSVISKDNLRLENFLVTFGLYDINRFNAMIKTSKNTNTNITECYILWMVIGNPSKLSVFSPSNREFQVDCIKKSITLQSNNSYYPIKTSYKLSEGCAISFNAYYPTTNYEPMPINIKIKLVSWSEDCIYFQIFEPNLDSSDVISDDYDQLTDIEITICVLYPNYENLKIDNRNIENSHDLIGCILTESTKVIPFPKFFPLISEISNVLNEIIEITQTTEYCKRICDMLKQRVDAVDLAVRDFKVKKYNQGFFNHNNYIYLQKLVNVITQIKNFMTEISQMKTLIKYIQVESIEKTFKDLCKEFDDCINSLAFTITIKNSDELEQLKADQEDLTQYLRNMDIDTKKSNDDVTEVETIMKLNFVNYEKTFEKPRKNGHVTKWVSVKNKSEEFAFKIISEEEKSMIQNQITILKKLHDWQNIIKIYGLTCKGNKWYLVSEWAKYGNLREYYTNYKDRFDLRLKLRMSLDIARGLNFLRTVEIAHHDIRAENILITLHEAAKLANFKLSRYITAKSLEQSQNLERVRYCAPELLERTHNFKYDHKCEVYSFGILLWEISEEKIPYEQFKDIVKITDLVCNYKYRESFSRDSRMPLSFTSLALKAVDHDPDFRPEISKMFEVLNDCFEESESRVSSYYLRVAKEVEEVGTNMRDLTNDIFSMTLKANSTNSMVKKLLDEQTKNAKNDSEKNDDDKLNEMIQSRIDKIFAVRQLRISDYEKTNEKPHKDGRVTKWVNIKNKSEEFAFKIVSEEERSNVQNQVTILKELHDWQNIMRIYGFTCEENKWYLVSEWAEYGNLREYYTNYKDRFDIRLKLRMSLDIARGLNFLRAVEIVHHDIRAENILITLHETAKLANFKFSRSLFAATLKQSQNLERVRYCAPELLESAHNFKYDHKCEVYSFGILLWEIAEERTPYEQYKDIVKIVDLVRNQKYRESFSEDSRMPPSFIKLVINAFNHDPELRPKITDTFEILSCCFKDYVGLPSKFT